MDDRYFVRNIPRVPGIYVMRTKTDDVAYVGLSNKLRDRIDQHLYLRDSSVTTGVQATVLNPDLTALNRYLGQWDPFMDLDITPVLDARGNSRTREGRPRRPQRLSHRTDTAVIAGSVLLAGVAICETLEALYERFINRDRRQEEPP